MNKTINISNILKYFIHFEYIPKYFWSAAPRYLNLEEFATGPLAGACVELCGRKAKLMGARAMQPMARAPRGGRAQKASVDSRRQPKAPSLSGNQLPDAGASAAGEGSRQAFPAFALRRTSGYPARLVG